MQSVATLIVPSGLARLTAQHLVRAAALLPGPDAPVWLAEGEAADLPFDLPNGPGSAQDRFHALAQTLRAALAPLPVDCIVQANDSFRRKKLFVADMDSTMIGQECIDELAAHVGQKARVAAITERAMRGEIAFEPALRERVALLRGLPVRVVGEVIAHSITLTPGSRTLVQTMRAHGAYTALVSGGFTLFTQVIGQMIGFDEDRANTLLLDGGQLSGLVAEPILGKQAKLDALAQLRNARGLDPRATLAVGDGANDLAMLGEAGLGIAFRAKPAVAKAAHACVDTCDLTALLFAQGFLRSEFVV